MNAPIFIIGTLILAGMCTILLQIKEVKYYRETFQKLRNFENKLYNSFAFFLLLFL